MSDQDTKSLKDRENDAASLEGRIRERAHHLWELEGRQEGKDEEYWHRAEQQLQSDTQAAYPPSASRAHRT
ncbi:DUF2934 domain-containing protein [Bradyrhizobium yuanmingense]|uniref:DUF2934 domain-containing protein n=1 Tax=Bradyrhizobium yuanmingense TaxID=108015 RepID=UPI0009DABDC8|nr:DUF2934 domain-containing protein [Bradyrhizobium yuanmingense]